MKIKQLITFLSCSIDYFRGLELYPSIERSFFFEFDLEFKMIEVESLEEHRFPNFSLK